MTSTSLNFSVLHNVLKVIDRKDVCKKQIKLDDLMLPGI